MNKLIRQYLPRNIDLRKISDNDLYLIQERINNRPRKKLNYSTPNEIFKSGAYFITYVSHLLYNLRNYLQMCVY